MLLPHLTPSPPCLLQPPAATRPASAAAVVILDDNDDAATVSSDGSDSWGADGGAPGRGPSPAAPRAPAAAAALRSALAAANAATACEATVESSGEEGRESASPPAGARGGGAAAAEASADPPRVSIIFRTVDGRSVIIALPPDAPFERAFAAFGAKAVADGWGGARGAAAAPPRFIFDGEPLPPDSTPAGVDMEGGEVVDVTL